MKKQILIPFMALALVPAVGEAASFWGTIKNQFNDCKYSAQERSEAVAVEKMFTPALENVAIEKFDMADFERKPWLREFRYVIVVNKAAKGKTRQSVRVFEYGNPLSTSRVSTGREGFELKRKSRECYGAPPKSYWSNTPTGYYTPKFLDKDKVSSSWDADMPYAIFYDIDNGLALHSANRTTKKAIGRRASGGCTRLPEDFAQELFFRVKETEGAVIPVIQPNGEPTLDESGELVRTNFQMHTYKSGKISKFKTYSALIIVEDVIE